MKFDWKKNKLWIISFFSETDIHWSGVDLCQSISRCSVLFWRSDIEISRCGKKIKSLDFYCFHESISIRYWNEDLISCIKFFSRQRVEKFQFVVRTSSLLTILRATRQKSNDRTVNTEEHHQSQHRISIVFLENNKIFKDNERQIYSNIFFDQKTLHSSFTLFIVFLL